MMGATGWHGRELGVFVPSAVVLRRVGRWVDGHSLTLGVGGSIASRCIVWAEPREGRAPRVVALLRIRFGHPAPRLATVERVEWWSDVPESTVRAAVESVVRGSDELARTGDP